MDHEDSCLPLVHVNRRRLTGRLDVPCLVLIPRNFIDVAVNIAKSQV
jgi:hypothetical protein